MGVLYIRLLAHSATHTQSRTAGSQVGPLTLEEGIDQVCPNRTHMLLATVTNLVTDSIHKPVQ